jgi:hypothetical protein
VRKFYPHLLPAAVLYSVYRCLLPKVPRLQYARFRAVLSAYADLMRGTPADQHPWATRRSAMVDKVKTQDR